MTEFSNDFIIAYAQLNLTVGDISGNIGKLIQYSQQAKVNHHADLIVFPELSVCGYLPEDLMFRRRFIADCKLGLNKFIQHCPDNLTAIVPLPILHNNKLMNAAAVIQNGGIVQYCFKQALPNYTVFDEKRYFSPGDSACVFKINNHKIGVAICEDLWTPAVAKQLREKNAEMIICVNASPYEVNKYQERLEIIKQRISETNLPVLYVNNTGGQDELVFDGGSVLINQDHKVIVNSPRFIEDIQHFQFSKINSDLPDLYKKITSSIIGKPIENIYQALVLGVRDYVTKNNFKGVIVGSSGGIDSAVTLAVATEALGADKVTAVMMPSCYTASMSLDDAESLANNLNIDHHVIPIKNVFENFIEILSPQFRDLPTDTTEENIQARCRGTILMALSNKTGKLVLTTGNRSEMAVGYATLYGDMAGGFAVLKDVYKQRVYELAEHINSDREIIPNRIITRPPSAELAPDQKDEDSLPPYEILDNILALYLDEELSQHEIIQRGFSPEIVNKIVKLVVLNEYKRRQAPPGIRINHRAFGRDRRYPITNRYQEDV